MRRWYGGGWQNLLKHFRLARRPINALELSFIYIEGLFFSLTLFLFPLVSLASIKYFFAPYFVFIILLGCWSAAKRKRFDLLLYSPGYIVLIFINAWVFLEQFIRVILLRQKNFIWFKPERAKLG
jgi:hypothetical protein